MKTRLLITGLFIAISTHLLNAQGGTWVWVGGSNITNTPPVYGTQGVASAATMPGAGYEPTNWIDQQGNFWLFGGLDYTHAESSDLWEYNVTTGMWTWMKGPGAAYQSGIYGTQGVPATSNNPGGRGYGSVGWTDASGNLWLWGGYGYDGFGNLGYLNDLWMYDISTNEWTWMKGSNINSQADNYGTLQVAAASNTPGARCESNTSWNNGSSTLWMYAGQADFNIGNGFYSDVWKYDISSNNWTWMSGPQGTNNPGRYGTLGVAASTNLPPNRGTYTRWSDPQGNFYNWGGIQSFGPYTTYSDVWKYDPVVNLWTWIAGDTVPNYQGAYGSYCNNNGIDGPKSRYENTTAPQLHCSTVFFTFGGFNGFSNGGEGTTNDLWMFDLTNSTWMWVNGPSTQNDGGNYGTQGVPAPTNLPPARGGHANWIDFNGNIWVFGGMDSVGLHFNDLWKYTPDYACLPGSLIGGINFSLSNNTVCLGDSVILTLSGVDSAQLAPVGAFSWIDTAHAYIFPDTTTTILITGHSTCRDNDTARVTVYVAQPGSINYILPDTQICQGNSAYITLLGLSGVTFNPSGGVTEQDTSRYILSPDSSTTYLITSTSSVCHTPDTGSIRVNVTQYNPITFTLPDSVICYGSSVVATVTGLSGATISPSFYGIWLDSAHVSLDPYTTTTFTLSGATSCGSYYSQNFTIYVSGSGQVNYTLSPPDVCQGDSAFLTLIGLNQAQILPNGSAIWVDSAHLYLIPDSTTTYTVSGISPLCGGAVSSTFTVYVVQPGSINYLITDSNICAGYDVYLQTFGASNIQINPYYYVYYLDSVDAYSYLYPDTTTTFMLTGNSVCRTTDTSYFTIHVEPFPNYTLSPGAICKGDSTLLALSGLAGATISPTTDVSWIDSAHAWLYPDTTTTYFVSGIDCDGFMDYLYITVYVSTPGGGINYTISDSNICTGGYVYLTISGSLGPTLNPFNYLYMIDSTDYYSYLYPTTTTTYTITGLSPCGGVDTSRFNIYVGTGAGYYQLSSPTICAGDTAALNLIGFASASITPVAGVDNLGGFNYGLSPDTTTTYTITGTSICAGNYYQPITIVVTRPIVDVLFNSDSIICAGDSVQICATPGFSQYSWNSGQGTTCIEAAQAGNYYCTVTDPSGCTAESNHLAVTVNPVPPVSMSVSGDTFTVYGSIVLQWFFNGIPIQGATGQTYIASQAGSYSVQVADSNGCKALSNPIDFTIIKNIGADKISVYPNPLAAGRWQVDVSSGFLGRSAEIYDADGRLVYSSELKTLHSEIQLDVAAGVYLLRIASANSSLSIKLVKL